jgi:hypothetical protein
MAPALAESHEEPDPDKKMNVSGEVRARWDYSENTLDAADDGAPDDAGDAVPYRARIAAGTDLAEGIFAMIEIQAFGYFGDSVPGDGSAGTPLGQTSQNTSDPDVDLYQGFVDFNLLGGDKWSLRLGRQEYTLGNELHFGDADFYNGTSFDGLRAMRDGERLDGDVFYFNVGETLLDDQREVWGATVNFSLGGGDSYLEPYLLYVRDTGASPANLDRTRVYTLDALWSNPVDEEHRFDWSAEAAMQSGETGPSGSMEVDNAGYIVEGWFGFTFLERHRVHAGVLYASGDDPTDPDPDNDAWLQLFPDEHANNRLGDIDLFGGATTVAGTGITNVMDLNAGWTWSGEQRSLRASLHMLTLAEEIGGEDDLGNEIDLAYYSDLTRNVGYEFGYAHLLPGDYLDAVFNGADDADDVMRAWWNVRVHWN